MNPTLRSLLIDLRSLMFRGRKSTSVRRWRPQWLPIWIATDAESRVHPHCPEEKADLFLAHNMGTTEIEVLNWLHATVCLLKPHHIVETGAADGIGTLALASACKANGFGMVHSIEIVPELCVQATAMLEKYGVAQHATFHAEDSKTFLATTDLHFDFGWFDSLCELRADEYEICLNRGILHGPASFHDTSPYRSKTIYGGTTEEVHAAYRAKLKRLAQDPRNGGMFESKLSRGIVTIYPRSTE